MLRACASLEFGPVLRYFEVALEGQLGYGLGFNPNPNPSPNPNPNPKPNPNPNPNLALNP